MPALSNVFLCAIAATVFWTALGLPLARLLAPGRALAPAVAPLLGWAVFNALALPILTLSGFTVATIVILAGTALAAASLLALRSRGAALRSATDPAALPWSAIGAAALLAVVPAMAILPKFTGDGVALGEEMYDHSKIAIIDDIVRLGLPAGNPFFGGQPSRLSYYYLWHFAAAICAKGLGISGWEADAALTWFTAFASLALMMGLAVRLSGRSAAALWLVLLCATLSLRPVLLLILGKALYRRLLSDYAGLPGWMLQASWSPQHLAAAGCVVLAVLLISRLAHERSPMATPALALVVVAGFESSTWIGGIAFAIAAVPLGLVLLRYAAPEDRGRFIRRASVAALLAAAIASPFLYDQSLATAARHAGVPIGLHPYEVIGPLVPQPFRREI